MSSFLQDVLQGLSAPQKYLDAKYFYDATGDRLFRQIMHCPEYYLTRCEMEIFSKQTTQLADCFTDKHYTFDVIELGAGDASKSISLLQELMHRKVNFTYYPVDISSNAIDYLNRRLLHQLPQLQMQGLNGDYFQMLQEAQQLSQRQKVVLFLGSNIGNIPMAEVDAFCKALRQHLLPGDLLLIGFDLQKDPSTILSAYNDGAGITRQFNLNLLNRINRELDANFDTNKFIHYPVYDPGTGACKSYLVSMEDHDVTVGKETFHFDCFESIYMEVSQKYTTRCIEKLALNNGFKPVQYFFDSKKWFVDAVWEYR